MGSELSPIYRYKVDLTGINNDNRVSKEKHEIKPADGSNYSIIVPVYGGFYAKTLQVRDKDYKLLTDGVDYVPVYRYTDATTRTGQEVLGAVLIINTNLEGFVYFAANVIGGDYAFSTTVETDITAWLAANKDLPHHGDIEGKPTRFGPGAFRQSLWKFDGYEPTIISIENAVRASILGDIEGLESIGRDLQASSNNTSAGTQELEKKLNNHKADHNNPHGLTAAQLGLPSNLQNFAMDTDGDINSDDTISTPHSVRRVEDKVIGTVPADHIGNTNNPHGISIHDIGGLTANEVKLLVRDRLPVGRSANSSALFDGHPESTLVNDVKQTFDASEFKEGTVSPNHLGVGTPSSDTILTGSGWRSAVDIFREYEPPAMFVYFEGPLGPDNEAIAYIRTKYNDPGKFPSGTLVVWNVDRQMRTWNGDGNYQQNTIRLMRAARREGSNWVFDYFWQDQYYASTNYWFDTAGTFDIKMSPGTYSVLAVGGGGSGNGYQTGNRKRKTQQAVGAGGGSGYATKTRITVRPGASVRVHVGQGGQSIGTTNGSGGEQSWVQVNGNMVVTANGGGGAYGPTEGGQPRSGGNGGSGGGASMYDTRGYNKRAYMGGANGTNGGTEDDYGWHGEGGHGMGSGYYSNLMRAIDPNTTHGFDYNNISGGGDFIRGDWGTWFVEGNWVYVRIYVGGGGGGMGTQVTRNFPYNTSPTTTGRGYGAGGGGFTPGVSGLVSLVRISY